MKLRLTSMISAIALVLSLTGTSALAVTSPESVTSLPQDNLTTATIDFIPSDAIILKETEETVYFDLNTGMQINEAHAAQTKDSDLFELTIKHTFYQIYGGGIDFGISMRASNTQCRIKQVEGNLYMDANTGDGSGQTIYKSALVPTYAFNAYFEGIHKFDLGDVVTVRYSYSIRLVNGEILNGGKISGRETLDVVR